jgi:hypothetical protein
MFTTKAWMYNWLEAQFNRKWNNETGHQETKPFVPLPPDVPVYNLPADTAVGVPTTGVQLSWNGGLWAHNYDIYFGTTPNPPLLESNKKLGPTQYGTDYRYYALPTLQAGTRYYWKVVSKTMAFVTAAGPVWSFTTAGVAPNNVPPSISLTSPAGGATFTAPGLITVSAAAADSDGTIAKVEFYSGNTLIGTDTTSPYSITWSSVPVGSYSLTAVATDNGNATTTSTAVSITVSNAPPPPTGLPAGFPVDDVPLVGGRLLSATAQGSGVNKGWGVEIAVDGDDAVTEAIRALGEPEPLVPTVDFTPDGYYPVGDWEVRVAAAVSADDEPSVVYTIRPR